MSITQRIQSIRAPRGRLSEPLTDSVLVERAARGDAIAFSELVNRHYRRAVRVAFGLLHSKTDAEDVVQDAFARVYMRLEGFSGASTFTTWLYRIVVNLSIDTLRRRRRERRGEAPETPAGESTLRPEDALWPAVDRGDPQAEAERRELAAELTRAFGELSEVHAAVLLLRELEGLSYEEIATILQIKKGTVMSRLFNARKVLQAHLVTWVGRGKKTAPEGNG
ncbi:MAG TPA: sigma-70 family RNA polymerase sigma factor [Myxococcota bacterium]|nr:sigma-70 family RNA polymerase sigma factor [Myxococcota bacterium]